MISVEMIPVYSSDESGWRYILSPVNGEGWAVTPRPPNNVHISLYKVNYKKEFMDRDDAIAWIHGKLEGVEAQEAFLKTNESGLEVPICISCSDPIPKEYLCSGCFCSEHCKEAHAKYLTS